MNGICDLQCRRHIVPCGAKLCRLVNCCDDHRVVAEDMVISDQRNPVFEACYRPVCVRYNADYLDLLSKRTRLPAVQIRRESAYTGQHCDDLNLLHVSTQARQDSESAEDLLCQCPCVCGHSITRQICTV